MTYTTEKQIGVRIPAELNDRLLRLAALENNHISAVTRRLLSKAIAVEEAAAGLGSTAHRTKPRRGASTTSA